MLRSVTELETALSEPTPGVIAALAALPGDLVILGVAGKMGLTLARMARRKVPFYLSIDPAASHTDRVGR